MKNRVIFLTYIVTVVCLTTIHTLKFTCGILVATVVLTGRGWLVIARRALLAILVFNSIVSISYCFIALKQGSFNGEYLLLLNLRVFSLTFLTFYIVKRVNLFRIVDFSPTLMYLLTLATSQIITFQKLVQDFQLALKSRTIKSLSLRQHYQHSANLSLFFLDKSLNRAQEIAQAMKSRGFFEDN